MSAHTPGPWITKAWYRHSPTTIVSETAAGRVVVADVSGMGNDAETLANARLIAAAPALLELAKQYLLECGECAGAGIDLDDQPCRECVAIRAVIAQASPLPPTPPESPR